MYSLMYIPLMSLYYNFHTAILIMIPWTLASAIYVLVQFIVTAVNGAAISLTDEEHNMAWQNYLERHMTHYEYDI